MPYVLMKILSHASAKKKKKKRKKSGWGGGGGGGCLRVWKFVLLLVVFKRHHGSEGVKPYKEIRLSSFDRRKLGCLPLQKKIWLSSIDRVKLGGTEENSVVFLWPKKIRLCFFNRRKLGCLPLTNTERELFFIFFLFYLKSKLKKEKKKKKGNTFSLKDIAPYLVHTNAVTRL